MSGLPYSVVETLQRSCFAGTGVDVVAVRRVGGSRQREAIVKQPGAERNLLGGERQPDVLWPQSDWSDLSPGTERLVRNAPRE